jgi:DNA-binding LacI/PurR family transcriptional regulator
MADVAAHVGVSRALVSLVFRDAPGASAATRERVFKAAAELGYRPNSAARVLRRNRSRHLGVLYTMRHPFDADLVEALYPLAERLGYDIVLGAMTPTRGEQKAAEELLSYRSEVLIVIGPEIGSKPLAALASHVPVIAVGRRFRGLNVDAIHTDDFQGVRLGVEHLVELGHRAIAHIDGGAMPGASGRRRGYRTTMRRHGLDDEIRVIPGDYTEESGARAAEALLSDSHLPTAVIAGNDRCAVGLLDSLLRAGISVPRQVSVIGYDDSQLARMSHINLTSVSQDVPHMAEAVMHAVVERLENGRSEAREIVLKPSLVVRETTGPVTPTAPSAPPLVESTNSGGGRTRS